MGPILGKHWQSTWAFLPVSYTNRIANVTTDDKAQLNGTAGESKADHFLSAYKPPKTDCTFTNSATCAPAEPNTSDSNDSCKIDLQKAEENPCVDEKDLPLAGISQDDK